MANKKISGFDDLRKTPQGTGDADITYVAGFAAFGTNDANTPDVNVQLSGAELIVSLQKKLNLSQFLTGVLPVTRGGTGLTSITTLQNVNVNYATDGTGVLPVANWLPTGGTTNQYIDYQGNWQTITTGSTYQAGDGIEFVTTTTPDTIKAKLKPNGGIEFDTAALALNLSASAITGTLGITDGGTGLNTVGSTGDSIRINSTSSGFEYYTPTDDNTTYDLKLQASSADPNLSLRVTSTSPATTQDTINFKAGTNMSVESDASGVITFDATNTNTTYTFDADGTSDPNLRLSDGTTPQNVQLVGSGNTTVTNAANVITISSTGGGVGDNVQTLSGTGATIEWDFTLGNSAIWEPVNTGAGNTPQILVESATASKQFPNGARGCLKIIPTNTTNFQLFSNSKLPSNEATINAQIAASNPSILYYFFDGTNFNWFYDVNMVDPIYSGNATPDPSVSTTNLVGFWWPGRITTLANGANVPNFTTWPDDAGVSSPLVGNLRSIDGGSGSGNHLEWYARDEAAQEAPYWKAAPAGTTAVAGFEEQTAFTNTTLTEWSSCVTFQVGSNSSSSYQGILDLDQDDDVAWYMYDRMMIIYDANPPSPSINYIQGGWDGNIPGQQIPANGFPKFVGANQTGNPNNFSLEDTWIFVHIAVNFAGNLVTTYIGCQATWDNRGGTIRNQGDTADLVIEPSGLYVSANRVPGLSTLGGETVNTVDVWRAAGSSTSYAWNDGRLGLCALWDSDNLLATTIEANWANIRQSYYIS